MEIENKPFAPFGAIFHQLKVEQVKLKIAPFFFCGKLAYEEAEKSLQNGYVSLCLPYGKRVDDFRWSIEGLRVVLYDTGGMSALTFAKVTYELLKQEVDLVCAHSEHLGKIDIHILKKDFDNDRHQFNPRIRRPNQTTRSKF